MLSEQSEEISLFGCDEFRNRFGQMLGFLLQFTPLSSAVFGVMVYSR
ncbi:hypothetical protein VCSRO153_2657 [Vibrio cholerae]|nr:hypothetical protein VCSRO153_2657 [Vibrio cholerae]